MSSRSDACSAMTRIVTRTSAGRQEDEVPAVTDKPQGPNQTKLTHAQVISSTLDFLMLMATFEICVQRSD